VNGIHEVRGSTPLWSTNPHVVRLAGPDGRQVPAGQPVRLPSGPPNRPSQSRSAGARCRVHGLPAEAGELELSGARRPDDVARRLTEAVTIGSVTDLEALAQELMDGGPADLALGRRISRLADSPVNPQGSGQDAAQQRPPHSCGARWTRGGPDRASGAARSGPARRDDARPSVDHVVESPRAADSACRRPRRNSRSTRFPVRSMAASYASSASASRPMRRRRSARTA
jgi:hypothetical protein